MTVEYRDIYQLMHHLRGMGENNALTNRRHFVSRHTLKEADRLYKVGAAAGVEGRRSTLPSMAASTRPSSWRTSGGWTVCEETKQLLRPKHPTVSLDDVLNSGKYLS